MRCPYCKSTALSVVDKRLTDDFAYKRRRKCKKCFKRFTTYERIEKVDLLVVKRDGTKEPYSRDKLQKSLVKAFGKQEYDLAQLGRLIDDIETRLLKRKSTVVDSVDIGRMVLSRLKWLYPIAYMRFASVYKAYESLEDMLLEIQSLMELSRK